jgi:protein tyrosine/serine phosphatase
VSVLDDIVNSLGALVGEVEDATGLRYPVTPYAKWVDEPVLMRGSRVDNASGYMNLRDWGFKKIIDLRQENPWDLDFDGSKYLDLVRIPIQDNTAPTPEHVKTFLASLSNGPAYVHCQAGVGRTGCMVAAYRVRVDGWTPTRALAEMDSFGKAVPAQRDWVLCL